MNYTPDMPNALAQLKTITSRLEIDLICSIARRYHSTIIGDGYKVKLRSIFRALSICHANGCPLDLAKLATAPYPDLMRDVAGITRFLNHNSGALTDCFLPRYAL